VIARNSRAESSRSWRPTATAVAERRPPPSRSRSISPPPVRPSVAGGSGWSNSGNCLFAPGQEAVCGRRDIGRRSRERETDELMASLGVEIDAGRRRDAGVGQHAAAEILAVIGQPRDIRIDVEGAVGRCEAIEAGARQLPKQKLAVLRIAMHIGGELAV